MTKSSHPFSNITTPPNTLKKPFTITQHGEARVDNYAWLRDENWQNVLQDPSVLQADIKTHLEAENTYYETATTSLNTLRDSLFAEMRARIKEDDASVPFPDGPFAYGMRYRKDGEYPIYSRTPRDKANSRNDSDETILFDGDLEGKDAEFFDIESVTHSPNHQWIAYGIDRLGSEFFDIRIRNIETGEELPETISKTDGNPVWAANSQSFYYIERDEHQRSKRVKRHFLKTNPSKDELIYEEPDDAFFLSVSKSHSGDYILISASNSTSGDVRFLSTDAPVATKPTLIAPRAENQLYDIDHHGEYFYILTNADDAVDFKIMRTSTNTPDRANWKEWLLHEPGTYVIDFIPFADYAVRLVRRNALPEIIIGTFDRSHENIITFDEDAYSLGLQAGFEFSSSLLRFSYSSPSTPEQIFDYNMKTGTRTLLKTQDIPYGHDASLYQIVRLSIKAKDGADIPVTVLHLKTTPIDSSAPLLLYGYGAYGITIPASFSSSVLSVVDRGAVYAIAHIRGGAAKGRQWYLDGKLDEKPNTFSDFATVARSLTKLGYGRENETVIYGGSAGGLLVGATLNLNPELFGGAIGAVPFVDVTNTISDKTLPLTPPEWDEWGNPITDATAYKTIHAYSPYDNLRDDKSYPPILATGGLADYRVTYWEPAKWVARLREETTGGPYFLKMNMEAGHGGSAARFERLKEKAHDYAFALALFGLSNATPIKHS